MDQKLIHQMWFQGIENMPDVYEKSIETWKSCNPDYTHMFWDEKSIHELIVSEYPEYTKKWISIDKIIKKCDAARYFLLYHFGGIYADLDTIAYRPIDGLMSELELNAYDVILSEESHEPLCWKNNIRKLVKEEQKFETIVGNAVLISRKGHGFWMNFLDNCFQLANESVLESFSTWHLTKFLKSVRHQYNVKVIPSTYLLAMSFDAGKSYATHMYHATWFNHQTEKPWEG